MARCANQKLKLLYLAKLFQEETDEEHALSLAQIADRLEAQGIHADRKTLYQDFEELRYFGLDVVSEQRGRTFYYYLGERDFELPELKLLVDSVQSAKFISDRKSGELIRKLEHLASVHQARQLQRQVVISGRVKSMNESIYYNVDALHTAIAQGKEITFRYFDYDMNKQRVPRRDGALYRVSPYSLVWNNENYYLVAYDPATEEMRHYRVDKMSDIAVTDQRREGPAEFDVADYARRHFGMYAGTEATVTLRFDKSMVGVVLDRFGQDVMLIPDGEDHFTVSLPLVISPQFYGWLFGLGDKVRLVAPASAVEAFRAQRKAVSALYD